MNNLIYSNYNDNYNFNIKNNDKNGLVPDVNSTNSFNLQDTLEVETTPITYKNTEIIAIKGNYEDTPIISTFFSNENINSIQKSIRYYVYNQTKKIIDKQSTDELYIIMRSILFQNGDLSLRNHDSIYYEVQKINKLVIDYSVHKILSEMSMYTKYIQDVETLLVPLQNPEYVNISKQLDGNPYLN
jgi:hypothetical protein